MGQPCNMRLQASTGQPSTCLMSAVPDLTLTY